MRSHIIERIPGMNNYEMLRECELLRNIMLSEPSIKKNKKYKVDQESLDRIIRSCEYYKALHDGDSIFRDYQKEIIKDSLSIIKQSGFV